MKNLVGVTLLALIGSQAGPGAASTTAEQIEQMERDRQQAFVQRDLARLDEETAEDYSTINSSGRMSTKPQMMANLRAARTRVESVALDDLHARVYGDTAVLTGRYSDVSVTEGVRKESHALFTRVLVKTNGRWRAVAYQQTALPDK
jgi:uncharacterized protein DUF4440